MAKPKDSDDTAVPTRAPAERRDKVMELVLERGTISAREIADMFDVSLMTAHRDFDALARTGVVRRFHGGVSAQPGNTFDANIVYRERARLAEKAEIGSYAARFVEPGMTVLVEDSTTTLALAEALVGIEPLTIITNFPRVVNLFAPHDEVRVIVLGGEYNRRHDAFLGLTCIEAVSSIRADVHFSSTSGITPTHAYQPDPDIVMVKRAMMAAADRSVLLMDHSKIGRTAVHAIGPLTDFDDVVVDSHTSDDDGRALREQHQGIHVAASDR